MKVGVDALGLPPRGGARTCTVQWLKALAKAEPDIEYVVFLSRHEPELDGFPNLCQHVFVGWGTRLRLRLWAQLLLPFLLRSERVQLVHFMKNLGVFGAPQPTITTILDLSRFKVPYGFSKLDVLLWRTVQPYLLRRANRVVAISNNTKRDLILEYRLPANKISVIYPGSEIVRCPEVDVSTAQAHFALPPRFIVNVGGLASHKNLYTLVHAFFLLKERAEFPHKLLIVGDRFHSFVDSRVADLLGHSKERDVVFTGEVTDSTLHSIYRAADLFVLPSLYEGFGLAPLEAMVYGVPVIVTRRGALPEIVGEAGLYLDDPFDAEGLARLMAWVLTDYKLQATMRRQGLERARLFSWQRTAESTLQLYKEVLSSE